MKAMELRSLDGMLMEALVFVVLLEIVRVICRMDVMALVLGLCACWACN